MEAVAEGDGEESEEGDEGDEDEGGARCFDDKSGVWEGFVAVPHTRVGTVEVSAGGAVAAVRRGVAVQIDPRRTALSRGRGAVS